jgi:outer membrane lipoprotein carrier protein
MRLSALAMAVLLVSPASAQVPPAGQPPSADAVARALQDRYNLIHDFTADFVHSYQGGVLRQTAVESGQLLVKKPGKMRWDYKAPERKTFVSDGRKLYSYLPLDKQVIVSDVPDDDHATTPALFLAGKGNLQRDFTVSFAQADAPAGTTVLKLVPRRSEAEYDWLMLAIDPRSLQIRTLITVDGQGGRSTFTFTNLKENVGLADKEFAFAVPRGVDVVIDRAASQ